MPCDFCGARQTDPVRGASPWKRGVRSGSQVLVCPDCQLGRDWPAELDHCPSCGSTAMVRRLGETHCRSCDTSVPDAGGGSGQTAEPTPGLAEEVAAALQRLRGNTE